MGQNMGRAAGARNLLTHKAVVAANKPGLVHDGDGLYLRVSRGGTKSWILRLRVHKKTRDMGLGSLRDVPLASARTLANKYRVMAHDGRDPVRHRKFERSTADGVPTIAEAIDAYIEAHRPEWTNSKHADQWQNTLDTYVKPAIGGMPVDKVMIDDILGVLTPIWSKKTETASRVRQRLESVIGSVYVKYHIDRRNPAQWRGLLDKLLPKPSKVAPVEHFPAMPYKDVPAFVARLRAKRSITARALEYTILTAARTSMVRGAQRGEFTDKVWTIPKGRMKGRKEFQIPLSARAAEIVDSIPEDGDDVFQAWDGTLSENAMLKLLERMGHGNVTVHGFRSSFRDWAGNETQFAREVIEEAMSHRIKDKAEASYRRSTALAKRRELMDAWAKYLEG